MSTPRSRTTPPSGAQFGGRAIDESERQSRHGEQNDAALLGDYQRGNPKALARLISRHQTALYNFAHYRLNSALAADEVTEEVFVSLANDAKKLSKYKDVEVHLYREARRICEMHRASPIPGKGTSGSEPIGTSIGRLEGDEKDVFLLREIAALGFPRIAEVMGQREGAVKLHLQNAFRRLQETLRDREDYQRVVRELIAH